MRRPLALLGALSALSPAVALAQTPPGDAPCTGCVVLAPAPLPPGPMPLLVVLHGDEGNPARLVAAWRRAAADAGVLLFAPRCPKEEGCTGSWWRWSGDPAWLERQVAALETVHRIDPARRYLAGWSGGATYLGLYASRWFPRFAALSLAGGGAPPSDRACAAVLQRPHPSSCAPVHYVMGGKNPLFSLAEATRDYLRGCGHELTWDLLPGQDHAGEWRAYGAPARTTSILAWLLAHPEGCGAGVEPVVADSAGAGPHAPDAGGRAAPTGPAASAANGATPPPALPPQASPGSRCSCEAAGAPAPIRGGAWILAIAALSQIWVPARPRRWFRVRRCGPSCSPTCT